MVDPVPPVQDADRAPLDMAEYQRRQKKSARITAIILILFCALTFFITIAKMDLMQ
jgi:hypothetical protein